MTENATRATAIRGSMIWLALCGACVGWLAGLSISPVVHIVLTSVIALVVGVVSTLAGLKDESPSATSTEPSLPRRAMRLAVDPRPVLFTLLGLAAGASVGIYARTNEWFGTNLSSFARQWSVTGLDEKEITRRLFDQLYPPTGPRAGNRPTPARSENETRPENSQPASAPPFSEGGIDTRGGDTAAHRSANAPTASHEGNEEGAKQMPAASAAAEFKHRQGVLFSVTENECARLRQFRNDRDRLADLMTNTHDERLNSAAAKCLDLDCLQQLLERVCPQQRSR